MITFEFQKIFSEQIKILFVYFLLQNQRTGEWNGSYLGLVPVGGREVRKGCRRVDVVQILCIHV
jgi:hypothetical protein